MTKKTSNQHITVRKPILLSAGTETAVSGFIKACLCSAKGIFYFTGVIMKFKILIILAFAASLFSACDSKAIIVFDSTTHDFGRVRIESTLEHKFTFTNRGNATLVIERIRSG